MRGLDTGVGRVSWALSLGTYLSILSSPSDELSTYITKRYKTFLPTPDTVPTQLCLQHAALFLTT